MLLSPRKKWRAVRLFGRAKYWMAAHIWLGTLCFVLIVFHSGFRWGGWLSTVLMLSFLGVIFSGFFGLYLQSRMPRKLLDEVPAETIYSQIRHVLDQYYDEAERVVMVTCGRDEGLEAAGTTAEPDKARSFVVVGAVRASGPVQGKLLLTRVQARKVPGAEPLLAFFQELVGPYLKAKRGYGHPLADDRRAALTFERLRARLDKDAEGVISLLESYCDQRRQFDLQSRYFLWLHTWLSIHLPLSCAMFLLMFVHIAYAWKFI
jgi:hypothetical protein